MEGTVLLGWGSPRLLLALAAAAVLAMAVLYLARSHAHHFLRQGATLVTRLARRVAQAGRRGGESNRRRARRALVQLAREAAERRLSRQTQRLGASLSRDLASFPHLHRQLHEQIQRVDEDYRSTVEAPPTPPEWLEAIETITRLPAREDPSVGRMLEDLRATLDRACHEALLAYRRASHRRHRVLQRMQPLWRRMDRTLASVDHTMRRLQTHTDRLDQQIDQYSEIVAARDNIVRRLAANIGPRCMITALGLAGVALAAGVAFHLIAQPLATLSTDNSEFIGLPFAEVTAASMLVMLVLAGGILLDSLRITRLFPEAAWIDPTARKALAITAAILLAGIMAAVAALAWMRDYLSVASEASQALAAGMVLAEMPGFQWLPALIHSLVALGVAILVAAAALPAEALVRQLRVLSFGAAALLCQGLALLADLLALGFIQLRRLLTTLYDLVIILPLALEAGINRLRQTQQPRLQAKPQRQQTAPRYRAAASGGEAPVSEE